MGFELVGRRREARWEEESPFTSICTRRKKWTKKSSMTRDKWKEKVKEDNCSRHAKKDSSREGGPPEQV